MEQRVKHIKVFGMIRVKICWTIWLLVKARPDHTRPSIRVCKKKGLITDEKEMAFLEFTNGFPGDQHNPNTHT